MFRTRFVPALAVLVSALALSACTGFGGPISQEEQISPEERRLRSIESKLDETQRRVENLSESLLAQQGAGGFADELRRMRGEVEQLRHDLDRAGQRDRQLYQDLDRRMQRLEGGTPSAGRRPDTISGSTDVAVVGGLPSDTPSQPRGAPTRDPAEEKAYMEAFDLLKGGKYQDAILGFENVVANWPNGRYTDTALYWAGESHYVLRNYEESLKQFGKLIDEHPDSSRLPDALLKSGFAHEELGRKDHARRDFRRIVEEHANSGAASLAQQRLQRLGQ